MAQTLRIAWRGFNGTVEPNLGWSEITRESVVVVTISEGRALNYPPITNRYLGAARMSVSNIAPYDGGVTFRVNIEWDSPLDFITDITVLGLPSQLLMYPSLGWDYVYPPSTRSLGLANKLMTKLDRTGQKMLQGLLAQEQGIAGKITASVHQPAKKKATGGRAIAQVKNRDKKKGS